MAMSVIWDLDGTLFDSYPVIIESIYQTFSEAGIQLSREQIREHAIRFSSNELFYDVADQRGVAAEALFERYRQISRAKYMEIIPMNGALETLNALQQKDVLQFVYTHRGKTTVPVLEQLRMTQYFREILTSQSGFARKPAPDALCYLIEKYNLDPSQTYYVGDRFLDMACAKNAGIYAILYRKPGDLDVSSGTEDYIVGDLQEILNIVKK